MIMIGKRQQDYLRRIVLRERDKPGGVAPALIEQTVRFALMVLEGILFSGKYGPIIAALRRTHRGATFVFYLDVSVEETLAPTRDAAPGHRVHRAGHAGLVPPAGSARLPR
jgi:hypothetical protein